MEYREARGDILIPWRGKSRIGPVVTGLKKMSPREKVEASKRKDEHPFVRV